MKQEMQAEKVVSTMGQTPPHRPSHLLCALSPPLGPAPAVPSTLED